MSDNARAEIKEHVVVNTPEFDTEVERGVFDAFAPNDVSFTKQMGTDLIEKLRNAGDDESADYITESMSEAFPDEEQSE